MRFSPYVTCVLNLTILGVFAAPAPEAQASPQSGNGIFQSVIAAADFYKKLNDEWDIVLTPLAQRQAVRYLRQFANSVDDLSMQIEDFTDLMEVSSDPKKVLDGPAATARLDAVRDALARARRNLHEFASLLPSKYSALAGDAIKTMESLFQTRVDILEQIKLELSRDGNANRAQLVEKSKTATNLAHKIKTLTDELAAKIAK